tara:strand:- start:507 stop:845 length:339 start_codon:yes stop_codon:yes gene_type:complete
VGVQVPPLLFSLNIFRVIHGPMKYRINTTYAWYDHHEGSVLILVYFIQNVPFTFDELPEIAKSHPEVITLADNGKRWTPEDLYRASSYLMLEECHPMMYELEIENPELLPVD